MWLSDALLVPGVDGGLDLVALFEQFTIAGSEVGNQSGEASPECVGIHAGTWQRLVHHKVVELLADGQTLSLSAWAIGARLRIRGRCCCHGTRLTVNS